MYSETAHAARLFNRSCNHQFSINPAVGSVATPSNSWLSNHASPKPGPSELFAGQGPIQRWTRQASRSCFHSTAPRFRQVSACRTAHDRSLSAARGNRGCRALPPACLRSGSHARPCLGPVAPPHVADSNCALLAPVDSWARLVLCLGFL